MLKNFCHIEEINTKSLVNEDKWKHRDLWYKYHNSYQWNYTLYRFINVLTLNLEARKMEQDVLKWLEWSILWYK